MEGAIDAVASSSSYVQQARDLFGRVGKEVQDPSCAINKHKTSELQLHDAPEELLGMQRNNHPGHIRRNPFPLAPMPVLT